MVEIKTIVDLVSNFKANYDSYTKSGSLYNETEVRSDFINPFFEALGWDMLNTRAISRPLREVISEANVTVGTATKKPDYEFRYNGLRKFFVEAKKPSVNILQDTGPALQLRRYGWSAGLPVSILTNFWQISIYDCTVQPKEGDLPHIGLIRSFTYDEFEENIDEIYLLLSKQTVSSGKYDAKFGDLIANARGEQSFDGYFLSQIESWRLAIARDLYQNNSELTIPQINYLVQLFLNRIVFLRICEDRNLEEYETLKSIGISEAVEKLLTLFRKADAKYDSGLFDLLSDTLTPSVVLSDEVLVNIVNDLYYPRSAYSFSVVSPSILGSIYEKFISRAVTLQEGEISIIDKPEIRESSGIYATPSQIVRTIVDTSFDLYEGDIFGAKIIDPAVGSGIFLTQAYEKLLTLHLEKSIEDGDMTRLRVNDAGDYYLNLATKKDILLSQLFGVDLDPQAAEVAKFSLHLKLLEDTPNGEINTYLEAGIRALPRLEDNIKVGNSLIDSETYFKFESISNLDIAELSRVAPFDWSNQYPGVFQNGGFNLVLTNPPYTRIQSIIHYSLKEAQFFQSSSSPYLSSRNNNFDKYQLFIERGYSILANDGILGYIVPHKFMTSQAGHSLRQLISDSRALKKLVHFGSVQLFPGQATTYTALLYLSKSSSDSFQFEKVLSYESWTEDKDGRVEISSKDISGNPWVFVADDLKSRFQTIEDNCESKLEDIATIFVGLQTSMDKIFIREVLFDHFATIGFKDINGKTWTIEKAATRPAILDLANFDNYSELQSNRVIVFPYKNVDGRNVNMSEQELSTFYPLAYEYLVSFKPQLSERSLQGDGSWFRFGRAQSLNNFNEPKLVIKNPALKATVAYDASNIMFTGGGNGPYYGVREKQGVPIYFLHALLNSELFDSWVKARSSEFRGGYFSYGKQFIENFPIPNLIENGEKIEKITSSWQKVISISADSTTPHIQANLEKMRSQILININMLINELYGLGERLPVLEGAVG
jgi:type I restriction-modification system DNA methylase subunit